MSFAKAGALLRRFVRDRTGAVAVTAAVALTTVVGCAGLVVDVAAWETAKGNMQGAADDAAYSAAIARKDGDDAKLVAKAIAASMGFVDRQNGVTVTVNNPPSQGKYAGNPDGLEVIITQPQKLLLASLYLSARPVASARAVAHAQAGNSPYCVLALDPSASQAAYVQDSSTVVDLSGCSMQVNSTSSTALNVNAGSLSADTVSITGNKTVSANATYLVGNTDAPGADPIPDPYANVQVPSYSCTGSPNKNVAAGNVPAGAYCSGMTFNSNSNQIFTLDGTYIVDGNNSHFVIQAGATVKSGVDGATIILTNGASVTINGGTVNLTAPTTGTFQGLVFFQDRNDTQGAGLGGGASQTFTGALYFPKAALTYNGSSSSSACTQIIADTITFQGNSTTQSNCVGTGVTIITPYRTSLAQ